MFRLKYLRKKNEEIIENDINSNEQDNLYEEDSYDVDFIKLSTNIVQVIGNFPIKNNGFVISRTNYEDNWDYSSFTTVYRELNDSVQFSNDETIYVEESSPTEEELRAIFELEKTNKITESKYLLSTYLETHPLVSDCHGGIKAQYSVTSEKQSLISGNYLMYTIAKQSGLETKLTWNATGQECEIWTEDEYVTLILQIGEYVKPLVSMQQSYEVQIKNCTTQEELDAIVIDYDSINKE